MPPFVTLPGIYSSGWNHWQTLWEADGSMVRFAPTDWDSPLVEDWVAALETAVAATSAPPVLVAHSLACLLVPIWAAASAMSVAGAFMVAPVDPNADAVPAAAWEFAGFPRTALPFPALVVGSLDDHYATTDWAGRFAHDLGADFVVSGALGHINADSGLGQWPQGRALLEAFVADLS